MRPNTYSGDRIPLSTRLRLVDAAAESCIDESYQTRQDKLTVTLILLLLCLFEIHTLQLIQDNGFLREVQGAWGILHGHAEYRVFQSRLLGPLLVGMYAHLMHQPFAPSYALCVSFLIALSNFICYGLVRRTTGKPMTALAATAAFALAVVFVQDASWFFLWDAIDLSTMTVFAYAALFARNNLKILVPLFVVELLNRESADFVALWIVLASTSAFMSESATVSDRRISLGRVSLGAALFAVGALWTHEVRRLLFRYSFDPKINLDRQHSTDGQWFTLLTNLKFTTMSHEMSAYAIAFVACIAIAFMLYRLIKLQGLQAYPVAALITAMTVSVWVFARVYETRVWLDFIPFGIFYAFAIENQRAYVASPERTNAEIDRRAA